MEPRSRSFYVLAVFFVAFVLFLYGPVITIGILSFQGPRGGLTFPMNGVSLHWFFDLFERQAVGDIWGSFRRSLTLGLMVMLVTVVISVMGGLAFRRRFRGSMVLFYLVVASLIIPSILISLGVGLIFNILDWNIHWATSGFGSQLTWTLPFGLLIMFAVFNRFDGSYEEAARDLGATPWQTIRHVVLPIIAPSLIGVSLFGFTLSYDEFARTLLTAGTYNTLPLEIFGMTTNVTSPVLYALGTLTTVFSFFIVGAFLAAALILRRQRSRSAADPRPMPPGGSAEPMHILIINPNSTTSMTRAIAKAARSVAAEGTIVTACNPDTGPASIQGAEDGAAALPGLFELFDRKMSGPEPYDAVIVACFDDTGLRDLKDRSPVPVVGIGEAAYHAAMLVGEHFSVVTTLGVSVPVIEQNLRQYGFAGRCARVRASGVPVLDLDSAEAPAAERIATEIGHAVAEDQCDAIVLGCAGMADLAQAMARRVGLPVIDGVAVAVTLCEALHHAGVGNSHIAQPTVAAS